MTQDREAKEKARSGNIEMLNLIITSAGSEFGKHVGKWIVNNAVQGCAKAAVLMGLYYSRFFGAKYESGPSADPGPDFEVGSDGHRYRSDGSEHMDEP